MGSDEEYPAFNAKEALKAANELHPVQIRSWLRAACDRVQELETQLEEARGMLALADTAIRDADTMSSEMNPLTKVDMHLVYHLRSRLQRSLEAYRQAREKNHV